MTCVRVNAASALPSIQSSVSLECRRISAHRTPARLTGAPDPSTLCLSMSAGGGGGAALLLRQRGLVLEPPAAGRHWLSETHEHVQLRSQYNAIGANCYAGRERKAVCFSLAGSWQLIITRFHEINCCVKSI